MISNSWLAKRKDLWRRLEELVERTNRNGYKGLTRKELQELALLYRQTASDLSVVREDSSSQNFARYLNQLLGRAHNIIYSGRRSSTKSMWDFFIYDYPQIFRKALPYTFLSFGIFLTGAILGVLLTATRPEFMHKMLGPAMVETIERREMWTHSVVAMKPIASSAIMTNNLAVCFSAFASGITFGLLTIWIEFFNGLLIGVIGTACWMSGMSLKLWSFVVGHGALELPAIFISGGAGLQIAHGLLFPGTYSRLQSLAKRGGDAVRLMVGTIPMLIVAGIVEGFISPTELAVPLKFALGAALFTMLVIYVSLNLKKPAEN